MQNDYPLTQLRPKTTIIGRETPGITIVIFRMCAERRAAQERRKMRRLSFVQFMQAPLRLKLLKLNPFEIRPVDN